VHGQQSTTEHSNITSVWRTHTCRFNYKL